MLKAKFEVNIYYHEEEKGIPRKASFIVFFQRHTGSICSGYKNYTKWKSNKNFATMHKRLFPVSRLLEENLFFHSINLYAKYCAVYSGCLFKKSSSLLGGKIWWEAKQTENYNSLLLISSKLQILHLCISFLLLL